MPKTVHEALLLLNQWGEEANILAGGTDLVPLMRSGVLKPKCLIDLNKISGLDYVRYDGRGVLCIGASTKLSTLENSEIVRENFPLLYEAVRRMSWPRIRNMATLSGNICRASPAADTAPPLLVLEADVRIMDLNESRVVPITSFFTGPGKTILQPGELVSEIRVPPPPENARTAFSRIARTAADLATVNVATFCIFKDKVFEDVRIALGGVAPTPVRAWKTESMLKGKKISDTLILNAADMVSDEIRPITDIRSTAEYRKEVCKVLVRQAINRMACT